MARLLGGVAMLAMMLAIVVPLSHAEMLPFCTVDGDGIQVSREIVLDGSYKPQIEQMGTDGDVRDRC